MNKAKYVQKSEMINKEELLHAELQIQNLIKEHKIKLKPKWYFILHEIFFWAVCVLLVFIASLAFGTFIDTLLNNSQGVLYSSNLVDDGISHISRSFLWFSIFFFIAILAYLDFIKLKRSYKIITKATKIIIVTYISLGVILYVTGTFEYVEQFFIKNIPYYSDYLIRSDGKSGDMIRGLERKQGF